MDGSTRREFALSTDAAGGADGTDAAGGAGSGTDVAIVGMSGRFPGAPDVDRFWELLRTGREGVSHFSPDELRAAGVPARLRDDPAWVPAHGILPGADLFDAAFFGMTPAEAEVVDPQHRLFLQESHAALEHAGYDPSRFDGLISVYAGAAVNTYLQRNVLPAVDQTATADHFAVMVGNDKDYLATRVAYKLDLRGPAYTVQTACSTSLVAIHLACQGLAAGECDMALAGGVTVKFPQVGGYLYDEGAILSADGHVRTFDAAASGTVLGNGVGVVVLKLLRDAVADGDEVHAVIKGTATNNDGSTKVSYAAPAVDGQAAVVREAHAVSGVDPRTIGHVEAHGTATRLGDPVEVSALTAAFADATGDTGFCAIGSVKSNIGHLDAAAGVAGVIKTVLMLRHGELVPSVNHDEPNPAIDFASGPFRVSRAHVPWESATPRRGGVSSFGIGGTNAHAVLEQAPEPAPSGPSRPEQVLVLSAPTSSALTTMVAALADDLAARDRVGAAELADVAHTLAVGRRRFAHRVAVRGADRDAVVAALRSVTVPDAAPTGGLSFVFDEHVPGAAERSARLDAEPEFARVRRAVLDAGASRHGERGESLAFQVALGSLWTGWGVEPVAAYGDGVGALAAGCVAGTLTVARAVAGLDGTGPDATGPAPGPGRFALRPRGEAPRASDSPVLGPGLEPLQGLVLAWSAGASVDWDRYFEGEHRRRVGLPTYPFEGIRCWIEPPAPDGPGPGVERPHPMLEANVSTLDTFAVRATHDGTEFYLDDHRVHGEPVMPAVGHLEMARAVGTVATGVPVGLRDVQFHRPLSYLDGARTVTVAMWPDGDTTRFEIAEAGTVYAGGALVTDQPSAAGTVDSDAVAARCPQRLGPDEAYARLRRHGLDYGPGMRSLRDVALGSGEAVGTVVAPVPLDGTRLHPALLDGALHTLVLLLDHTAPGSGGFLPFAVGSMPPPDVLTGTLRVHVEAGGFRPGDAVAVATVRVTDTDGRLLARLDDVAVRVLAADGSATAAATAPEPPAAPPAGTAATPRDDHGDGGGPELWQRRWAGAAGETSAARPPECVVIADDAERAAPLREAARTAGAPRVRSGVGPGTAGWVLVDDPTPEQALTLVRQLLADRPTGPVRVLLVHEHDELGAVPAAAALAGLARTVRAENPLLVVQVVGVEAATDADVSAAVAAELGTSGADVEVRHTAAGREVPSFAPAVRAAVVDVAPDGVYVVSGGAGGLGRLVADHLVERSAAAVVLLGRSVAAGRTGRGVLYRQADVTDADAVRAVLDDVRATLGPIRGVVHAAGVLRDGFLFTKTTDDLDAVLAPKVDGVEVLDEATAHDPLDFFVSFSSVAAHVGSVGQADYAYANAYLEAHAATHRCGVAVAWPMWADGGMRQSAEAAAELAGRTGLGVLDTGPGLASFDAALGMRGTVLVAHGDHRRIAGALGGAVAPASTGTAPTGASGTGPTGASGTGPTGASGTASTGASGTGPTGASGTASTGASGTADTDRRPATVELLRGLVAAATKLDPARITEDEPFDRLGIDSLAVTALNRELDRHFTGLPRTLFFEYRTLGELAGHLARQPGGPAAPVPSPAPSPPPSPAHAGSRTRVVHRGGQPDTAPPDPLPGDLPDDAVAVVGLAGRYPMADDLDRFWANLREGRDCVTGVPADRWRSSGGQWGGFLGDVDRFDPLFFGISPRHAELMDPQERLFLQTAWHAVEDAGHRRADLAGRAVGVFVGVMYGEYQFTGAADALRGGRPVTGSSFATIANRVSYVLDVTGPSMALDTMCSSSLTALHLACASVRRGECEMAVAGGVNVSVHPYKYAFLGQGRYLSSDGRCRSFGEGGDGYVPGEGVGAVLLKPYRRAVADGDRVHGVVLGSALNHGARSNGFTVPSPRAQRQVITAALRDAGTTPDRIGYVEAHGTGTSLGDPIEIGGLDEVFTGAGVAPGSVPVGSVKSNVGHLESAAGIVGLTKVLLQFRHSTVAPSLHSARPNPNVDLTRTAFRVPQEAAPWPAGDRPRIAGLSSFGAGGANAHVVVSDAPAPVRAVATARPAGLQRTPGPVAFVLSAADPERLRAYARRALDVLDREHVELADLCFTLQVGREPMGTRLAVVSDDGAAIRAAVQACAEGAQPRPVTGDDVWAAAARTWLGGGDVDWAALHPSGRRRVAAPLYPFADERYWVPFDPAGTAGTAGTAAAPHPLLDVNDSTLDAARFRTALDRPDGWLTDHVIGGRPLLAGAATLEMALAAADLAEPGVRHDLREVTWSRPIGPDEGTGPDVVVTLGRRDGGLDVRLHGGRDGTGDEAAHARGAAVPFSAHAPARLDLDALRERLPLVRDRAGVDADYRAAGFDYGPAYRVVDEVRSGGDEALVRLSAEPVPGLRLHPGLLDGALRACHWAGRDGLPDRPAVPFSLGSLTVHGALPARCHAHARLVGDTGDVRRFDVTVLDDDGRVLAELRDFAGRVPAEAAGGAPVAAADIAATGTPTALVPAWRPAEPGAPGDAADTLLVLAHDAGPADALAATGVWTRVLDVREPGGVAAALGEVADAASLDVASLWGTGPGPGPDAAAAEVVDETGRAVRVLDELVADATGRAGRVRVVHAHPAGRPDQAAVAGFGLSTAPVAPRFELVTLAVTDDVADRVPDLVAAELRAPGRAAGADLRVGAGGREVRALVRAAARTVDAPLPDGAVCVLTGGFGAVGRVLGLHLARTRRARLVLLGRSAPDEAHVRALTDAGATVLAVRADVTDPGSLGDALAAARDRFGRLDAVLHLAGTADTGRAGDGDTDRVAGVLAAKARGLIELDRLTRDDRLSAFVAFSSVSSVVGDLGGAAYATANRLVDVLVEARADRVRSGERHGVCRALDWPLWAVGGVDELLTTQERDASRRRVGMDPLTAEQGVAAFEYALTTDAPWLVPAHGDPAAVEAALLRRPGVAAPGTASVPAAAPAVSAAAVPAGTTAGAPAAAAPAGTDDARDEVVRRLTGVLSDVLRLPPGRLDPAAPLDEYGLDSVLAVEGNAALAADFPGLRGTAFFEFRSVDDLAAHLLAEHPDAVGALVAARRTGPAPGPGRTPAPGAPAVPAVTAHPVPQRQVTARGDTAHRDAARGDAARRDVEEEVAIIGIAGRYPGADDLDTFWANLLAGHDAVTPVPGDRWDADALYDPDPAAAGRSYGRHGGFLSDVDAFDSLFFQIPPSVARTMDPQERLFLQTAWAALEDAGYPPSRLPAPRGGGGRDVGVFVGVMWDDYAMLAAGEAARGNPQVVLGNRAAVANQVSYFGDFRGPSVVVDTACSASLVALHQACESLRRRECAYAVAGGVNVAVHADRFAQLSAKTMLSTDGRCRAFGAGGDGYVPGEGVGAVLLKPLSAALADGDTVHAVIRASVVAHGGRTSGFTVPNPHAQQALVARALEVAGVSARTIGAVEAHGTGTALGDPIEHTGLAGAFAAHTSDVGFCALGSVKSGIGHLEGAAGIAGVTKAVLQLRHATLAPTLHAAQTNPIIDFGRSPFRVQQVAQPWAPVRDEDGHELPRRVAVSSFGAGGTNAHVILEEYRAPEPAAPATGPELVVLSARDADRLRATATALADALTPAVGAPPSLGDVAHTLRVGREPMAERAAFVAADLDELVTRLRAVAAGEDGPWLRRGTVRDRPPLAGLLGDDAGGREFLSAQIRAGRDTQLAALWTSGVAVDWDLLDELRPGSRRRVPLPTYPFEAARHWITRTAGPVPGGPAPGGPAAHRVRLSAADPVVGDHPVGGTPTLPGTGHLDLVCAALGGMTGRAFVDVRWALPVPVAGTADVEVRIADDRFEVHHDGALRSYGALASAGPRPAAPALADVRGGAARVVSHDAFYAGLADLGLTYGGWYRRVRDAWIGDGVVLAGIGAPPTGERGGYALHPGVLDAALHTLSGLLVGRRAAGSPPLLPFAADRVDVHAAVPATGWSLVRERGHETWDVLLLDDDGSVAVAVHGLVCREAPTAGTAAAAAAAARTVATAGRTAAPARTAHPAAVPDARPGPSTHVPRWVARPASGVAEPARRVLVVAAPGDPRTAHLTALHPGADVAELRGGAPDAPGGTDPDTLDRALAGAPGLVYLLVPAGAGATDGPLALHRLARALGRAAATTTGIRLKIVTSGAFPLGPDERADPAAAGVVGMATVLDKELPRVPVACVDTRADEFAAAAERVRDEPFGARAEAVSLRAGVRRVRVLRPVALPAGDGDPWREGGVYLVVGGLGTIGRDTCRHLARRRASILVVGRSTPDAAGRAVLDELTAAGAQVEHLAADLTEPGRAAQAVRFAHDRFGALHGVIHSAMVLVDRPVAELTEGDLVAAIRSKADTTVELLAAVRDEPLDLAVFYSSGTSFAGNQGQSGYAAGCWFADAHVAAVAGDVGFGVHVLNWGYWHDGGDAARAAVLQRVRAAGLRPIGAAEGMATLDRVLVSGLPQVLAVDADDRVLDGLGVDRGTVVEPNTVLEPGSGAGRVPDGPAVFTEPEPAEAARLLDAYRAAADEVEHLAVDLLAEAATRLGLLVPGTPVRRSGAADRFGIVGEHRAVFDLQLDLLRRAGHLIADPADPDRLTTGRPAPSAAELDARVRAHTASGSGVGPVVGVLRDCMTALPEVLTGRRSALDVLFPGGSTERVAPVYDADPVARRCNEEVARLVGDRVRRRLSAEPGAVVRVLEIGAGTGGTTAGVLAALAPWAGSVDYVCTDVSPALVRAARTRFSAQHPGVDFRVLDVEGPLPEADVAAYDVVLATNVLHATSDLERSVGQAKTLLRRGGLLVLDEGTGVRDQMALIFGLAAGWWAATDREHRLDGSPLAGPRQWCDLLAAAGFTGVRSGSPHTGAGGPAYQSVIVGVSDGVVPAGRARPADREPARPGRVATTGTGTGAGAGHLPGAGTAAAVEGAVNHVTSVFAGVLEMGADQLDPDLTFEHFGVDSLVALQLTRALEADLGALPATLLFEQITITRLARWALAERGDALGRVLGPPPTAEPQPPAPVVSHGGDDAPRSADVGALVDGLSDEAVDAVLALLLDPTRTAGGTS